MEEVRVLADSILPMRWGLVAEAIDQCPQTRIVAHGISPEGIPAAIEQHRPQVVILGSQESLSRGNDFAETLGHLVSVRRVITLFDRGGVAQLREWRQSINTIEELSIESLCAAIRGSH
ncbi:hypothetical protein [Alteraurantiacibacter aquimixticola]|uniref:DNA-binding response regulator n=1 Tax=Alteraurantiacibacter aquimixticola TaxID=2489173 RepID=A0A4T3EYQ0_9SPHN|nr:hypothetical protein [Alteraurantiacibacter aquimixticola]TIX49641.1 hypothetical protein E5222_12485 [Alteraurantiacibacter aquimixticola]